VSYSPVALGFLPGGSSSFGSCMSADGTTIGGWADDGAGNQAAVLWDGANAIVRLPDTTLAVFQSRVNAVSADAGVAVGRGGKPVDGLASIWIRSGGYTRSGLSTLGLTATPIGLSADGARAVGAAANVASGAQDRVPVIWDAASPSTPPIELQRIVNEYPINQTAWCASANGGIVFGAAATTPGGPAMPVRWTGPAPGPGVIAALDVPVGCTGGAAVACTPDGNIAVGYTLDAFSVPTACYWTGTARTDVAGDQATGVDLTGKVIALIGANVDLNAVNSALPLLAGAGSALADATGVSYTGTGIAGWGYDSLTRQTAIRWTWSGASPPPFPPFPGTTPLLNLDNVVVTSLTTESPCTVAQYATPPSTTGGPVVGLRWSDTRGQTFGNAVPQALSTDPLAQLQWNRTGYARDRVFELFWSAAAKTALNGAFVIVDPWKS